MVPFDDTSTGGEIMSRSQYRLLAETSPGSTKFGSVDSAILCARPMPDSSMPPHHTGNAVGLRQIMDSQRFAKSAHASELDVENAAGLQADRLFGVMRACGCIRRGRWACRAGLAGPRDP